MLKEKALFHFQVMRDVNGAHKVSISGTACLNGEFELVTK